MVGLLLRQETPTSNPKGLSGGDSLDMPYNRHIKTKDRVTNLLEAEQIIYKKFPAKE